MAKLGPRAKLRNNSRHLIVTKLAKGESGDKAKAKGKSDDTSKAKGNTATAKAKL